ncbi:uncharacterized protein LOC114175082 [Vigna unguiculata]|uniref:uncharacterized protein LOC114175082 n=1 Tax=Vigna unguiculata TaxID=3917 RepID=UPI0010166E0B|nr:uncharacterized protein LOC114175082 [Vigna unguiculata]
MAGIGRAIKSRKLTPRFVGAVAYEIALPPHLANLHNVFHVSQLRKYITDPSHVLESGDIQIREDLTVNTGPMRILDSQVKKLRGKEIKTVKVMWDETTQEMTWEMEDRMRQSYPHLFLGREKPSFRLGLVYRPTVLGLPPGNGVAHGLFIIFDIVK